LRPSCHLYCYFSLCCCFHLSKSNLFENMYRLVPHTLGYPMLLIHVTSIVKHLVAKSDFMNLRQPMMAHNRGFQSSAVKSITVISWPITTGANNYEPIRTQRKNIHKPNRCQNAQGNTCEQAVNHYLLVNKRHKCFEPNKEHSIKYY